MEWCGKRAIGAPTGRACGKLGASTPSFNVTTSSGKINISAAGHWDELWKHPLFDSGGKMKHKAPRIDSTKLYSIIVASETEDCVSRVICSIPAREFTIFSDEGKVTKVT